MVNYKLHVPKNTLYYSDTDGTHRTTWFEYWTTVTVEEDTPCEEIIKKGKKNLQVQIADSELFDPKLYFTIGLNNSDIEVIIPQN